MESGKVLELLPTPAAHRLTQLLVAIAGEEQEWRDLVILLAHEQQRRMRRQQQQSGSGAALCPTEEEGGTLAVRSIPHLIMVLDADHIRRKRHILGRSAPILLPELK